jgi:hypothetical protein
MQMGLTNRINITTQIGWMVDMDKADCFFGHGENLKFDEALDHKSFWN